MSRADRVLNSIREAERDAFENVRHVCHWPGCNKPVPPAMWGCKGHWFALPKRLRDRIWQTYRRGQEVTKTPSPDYLEAAKAVQRWIREYQISRGKKS